MLIHCACGGATQPLTMASQQEDPNGSADQPTAGGDATGAVAPDPFVDAFSGRLDLDVVERKRERPLPLPPTHLAMWQQCNVAISQYRNIAIPQSRTANAPMLPPRPHAHRGSHRPSRTQHHHHHAESFSLDKAPDFTAPPPTHYRKFKRLLAPRGTAAFDNDPTVQAVPIAVLTSAGQVRKLKTRPSDPYFEETGKSSTIISQVTHVAELLITYDGPVRQPARPPADPHPDILPHTPTSSTCIVTQSSSHSAT